MSNTSTNEHELLMIFVNDYVGDYCACEFYGAFKYENDKAVAVDFKAVMMDDYRDLKDHTTHEYSASVDLPCSIKDSLAIGELCAAHVLFPDYRDSFDFYADYSCEATNRLTGERVPVYEFVPYDDEDE